jgi:GAF domain-containing protein
MIDKHPMAAADAFAQLGRIKLGETSLDGVLQLVARLAQRTIPGADEVSVTLVRGSQAHTAVFTGDLALALDESQYELGHGPCLDASVTAATLSVPEMSNEIRWPDWAARARRAGVHSSLAIGLPVHETVTGALNVYATQPEAFDDEAVTVGQTYAGYAAVALANAHLYNTTATLAEHMRTAMESRAVIEQAKGIIMGDQRCTADEAFRILTRMSQDTNHKLRDVAATIVTRAGNPQRRP